MNECSLLAGVIGDPIAHSKSPLLHGHWLKRYGIDGFYIPMRVTAAALPQALRALPQLGFRGVNVTLPHKEAALNIADRVSDRAALIGAANTLSFTSDGAIHADNTDGVGFIANLCQGAPNWQPQGGPALVLGAGGAARAILSALLDAGVPEIRITNRTKSRAMELASAFGPRVQVVPWSDRNAAMAGASLLVNTTSLGMTGKPALDLSLDALPTGAVVTDIVYAPLQTPLLAGAAAKGCVTVDGLGMLLHQAAPGFQRWFGVMPQVDEALRAAVLG